MRKKNSIILFLPDENASKILAIEFSKIIEKNNIILLEGEVGSGKTTFARFFIRNIFADENLIVPSPTFSLIQPYKEKGKRLIHADLYRIFDESEIEELGLFADEETIILVEWPQNAPNLENLANWKIRLKIKKNNLAEKNNYGREAEIIAYDNFAKLKKLKTNLEQKGLK